MLNLHAAGGIEAWHAWWTCLSGLDAPSPWQCTSVLAKRYESRARKKARCMPCASRQTFSMVSLFAVLCVLLSASSHMIPLLHPCFHLSLPLADALPPPLVHAWISARTKPAPQGAFLPPKPQHLIAEPWGC
ncbi:hypothetical protein ABPG77_003790 [Micractinium sp. CCAP 211/92]